MDSIKYSTMSITEMFDRAFYIHKKHIGTSALYMLVASAIIYAVVFLVVLISVIPLSATIIGTQMIGYGVTEIGTYISFAIIMFIFILLVLSLQIISHSGIIVIGSNGFLRNKIDIGKALEGMFKNIPRVLSVVIAGALFFIPLTAVLVGIIIVLINDYQILRFVSSFNTTLYLVGIIIATIVLLAWCVYFMTIHIYSVHVAILEKLTFFKALKRSRELVKGRFWRTLGSYILFSFVVSAITYSIYLIIGLLVGIIFLLIGFSGINEDFLVAFTMISNLLMYPVQIILALFIGPIPGIFLTILYYNQRFRKDGYDLELNLVQLKNESSQ